MPAMASDTSQPTRNRTGEVESNRDDSGLVDTKFQAPWSRPGIIARPMLMRRLTTTASPIIAVVGPAGYGKSTLLGQWATASELPVFWLGLDAHDNDPAILLSNLVAVMNMVEPADPELCRSLLAEAAVDTYWSLRRLAALVSSRTRAFGLVIDHAESVTDQRSGDLLATVALNLPPGCRVAFASRSEPPLPLARLRAQGAIEEIGLGDLAMDESEAMELLAEVNAGMGVSDMREVMQRTEGWPVGLYLGALTSQPGPSPDVPRSALRGDDRMAADYLRSEVLASLSASARTFLTRTSVLAQLSGPLCDAAIAGTGSQELLESLERSNLLLIPLDRQRRWYRCHHLLLELLRSDLERTEPELVARLQGRAAAWFEANDEPEKSIDHAQAAGDADRAARIFGQIAQSVYVEGRTETIERWITWFHERGLFAQYPHVAAMGALVAVLAGDGTNAELLVEAAAEGDPTSVMPDGSPVAGLLSIVEACLCRHGPRRMRDSAATATSLLVYTSPYRGPASFLEGAAAVMEDEWQAADRLFTAASAIGLRYGGIPTATSALALRASIAIRDGDTRAAQVLSDEALAIASDAHLDMHAQLTAVHAVAARLAILGGDLDRGRSHLALAARLRPLCFPEVPFSAIFLIQLAEAYIALADPAGARAVLRQIRDILVARPKLGVIADECDALRRKIDESSATLIGVSSLTAAELRLVPLLPTHLTYKEIGERLHLSRNTIKTEASAIFRKLGVSSRSEAVVAAQQIGLLGPTALTPSG